MKKKIDNNENIKKAALKHKEIRNSRLNFLHFLIIVAFVVMILRAIQFQIIDRSIIKSESDAIMTTNIVLPAKRGTILDRNGKIIATSVRSYYLVITHEPNQLNEKAIKFISEKSPNLDIEKIKEKLLNSKLKDVTVLENISSEDAEPLLDAFKDHASLKIGLYPKETRYYPNGDCAAQVIGFLRSDGVGQSGLEYQFEEQLKGKDGYIRAKTDAKGRKLALSDSVEVEPIDGATITTTIDVTIQYFVQEAIKNARKVNNAKKIMAIVQDAKTGEILAMASDPSYDLNNPRKIIDDATKVLYDNAKDDQEKADILQSLWRNPLISDVYEPGSTFKILTGAAGLEEGVVTKQSKFYCGSYKIVDGSKIFCWVRPNSHGEITLERGFQESCNVVFMDVAEKIGAKKMFEYIDLFHLTSKTGITLPGEANPILISDKNVKKVDLARMSFGHTVTFAPIQIMNILQTISNDGELILPSIVKYVRDKSGNDVVNIEHKKIGKILSHQTVQNVKDMIELVVEKGSGAKAKVPGYKIGGKTGTSVKYVNGKYIENAAVVSFAAIVPTDNPVFNVLVVVDEPEGEQIIGSRISVPIARDIIYNTISHLGIQPNELVESKVFSNSNFVQMNLADARKLATSKGLNAIVLNIDEDEIKSVPESNLIITKQYPIAGTMVSSDDEIIFVVEKK